MLCRFWSGGRLNGRKTGCHLVWRLQLHRVLASAALGEEAFAPLFSSGLKQHSQTCADIMYSSKC